SRFDQEILKEGPRAVNPMAFPRTVINSPAGHVAIKYGLTGLNTTISSGAASSLQAIGYAADFIHLRRAQLLLPGGGAELAEASHVALCRAKLLSGSCNGSRERSAPFDADRNGMSLAEGAAVVVVESLEHARARNATILAEVLGFATTHDGNAKPT